MIFLVLFVVSQDNPSPYEERNEPDRIVPLSPIVIPPNIGCKARNTFALPSGECACKEGFDFGDPSNVQGCYKCEKKCLNHSFCEYPGQCKCYMGYIRGNSSNCQAIVPELSDVTPDAVKVDKPRRVNASYIFVEGFMHDSGFCKFGDLVVSGNLDRKGHIECVAPMQNPGIVNFSISFDNKSWSYDFLEFTYLAEEENVLKYIIAFIGVACIVIGIYLIHQQALETLENEPIDEEEPFNTIPKKSIPLEDSNDI